jgi:hypothetical protein
LPQSRRVPRHYASVDRPGIRAAKVDKHLPQQNATGVAPSANLTATFSEMMMPSSINTTAFKLLKLNLDGSTTQVTDVMVSLSTDGFVARPNPFGTSTRTHLAKGITYKGVVTTDVRYLAGNQLDQHLTRTGLQQKTWTFATSP